jgi:sigma-B regulation protein RsbU (phosphoserine phosphatase)
VVVRAGVDRSIRCPAQPDLQTATDTIMSMWKPPIPVDEEDRLKDLRRLDLLLTTPEEPLDRVTQQLSRIFNMPGAFISFIDKDTQYYKSAVGLPQQFAETRTEPREISLCSYVVGTNKELVVEDLSTDDRFRDNPAVSQFGVRFYAGAPLIGDSGNAIGSLCIVDHRPRTITPCEQQMLGLLAEGVMAQVRLQAASRQLLERSLQIERDLQQAVDVQRFMLPDSCIESGGWRVEHVYRPIEHLGGDLLDVQRLPNGVLALLIADVTGHGTTAALTAAMTKTAYVRAISLFSSPGRVLSEMNRELLQVTPPGQFITAQAIMLDANGKWATIASAGHPYPMLMRRSGIKAVGTDNGLPLLVHEQEEYRDMVLDDLNIGDSILLYTDGAVEVTNSKREQLGFEGLRAIVGSLPAQSPSLLDTLLEAVVIHGQGRLADDIAFLLVRRCQSAP